MKLRKLLSILLTFATVICMFSVCAVPASARATAWVTLTSDPSYGGKVSFDGSDWGGYIGRSIWIESETVTVYAKAEAGYKFVRWGAPVNSTQDTVTVRGLQDKGNYSITAYFEKIPDPEYNITVRNGSVRDYGSQQNVTSSVAGRKIMITADPAPQSGMVFDKWVVTDGQVSVANASEVTTTFIMPANAVTLEATYKQSDPNAGKKVSIYFIQNSKYGQGEYELQVPYGTTFEFPPSPFGDVRGYKFTGWHEAETTKSYKPGAKAVATEATYYVADYEGLPMTVHFEIYDSRTASGRMSDVQTKRGSSFTLPECTFTPKKGYIFDEWMMYGAPGTSIQLGNSDEVTIWAKFEEDPDYSPYCIITFDNGYKGSRHDTYTEKVRKNSAYKLPKTSFTRPETGVKFKAWDMGEVGKSIEISDENEITITAVWAPAGDLSDCTVTVNYGDEVKDKETYLNYLYRNSPITPVYEVKTKSGYILKEGEDFTAKYSDNINAGEKAVINLTGKGFFTGTKKAYFTIKPLPVYEIMSKTHSLYKECMVDFYIGAVYSGGKEDLKLEYAWQNNVRRAIQGLSIYPIDNYYNFEYNGEELKLVCNAVFKYKDRSYPLKDSNFKFKDGKALQPDTYLDTISADSKNITGKSAKNSDIEQLFYYVVLRENPVIKSITKVKDTKYQVKYKNTIKNEHCYVQIKVTEYDENGKKLGYRNYSVKSPKVNAKNIKLKYFQTASIGVKVRYVVYYDHGYKDKNDNRNYTYGKWTGETKYQIKEMPAVVDISKT